MKPTDSISDPRRGHPVSRQPAVRKLRVVIEVAPTSIENLSISELRLIDAVTDAALALEGARAITGHLVKAEQFD